VCKTLTFGINGYQNLPREGKRKIYDKCSTLTERISSKNKQAMRPGEE
jgi:hypothetical protein